LSPMPAHARPPSCDLVSPTRFAAHCSLYCVQVLKSIYPQTPEPQSVLVTRWGKDVWARGSYSFVDKRGGAWLMEALAAPEGRLLFAGGRRGWSSVPRARSRSLRLLIVAVILFPRRCRRGNRWPRQPNSSRRVHLWLRGG
jgi:hypothetical protein